MGRVIAVGEGGRPQAPVRDDRFGDVLGLVVARNLLGRPLLTPQCRDFDHADEIRRALYRSAKYYCSCGHSSCTRRYRNYPAGGQPGGCPHGGQRISARADVVKDADGRYYVQVTFRDKTAAMQAIVDKYGPDPDNWPYNPWARRIRKDD